MGANGSELGVWDIRTQQRVFLGKGAKPNRIGLVDRAHNSAVAYIPGADSSKVGQGANVAACDRSTQAAERPCAHVQVLVGTAKHRLRLYDVRAHRRPALDLEFGTSRVTSLAVEPDGECLLCKVLCPHCKQSVAQMSMVCALFRAASGCNRVAGVGWRRVWQHRGAGPARCAPGGLAEGPDRQFARPCLPRSQAALGCHQPGSLPALLRHSGARTCLLVLKHLLVLK